MQVSAYVIVDIEVTDPARYETYKALAPATVEAFGGRYLARGGSTEVFEGEWQPHRLVILEFPTLERAREWIDSDDYAPARRMRQASANTLMVAVEGV
jgi:uncharacterized protein (DUF1330 family)